MLLSIREWVPLPVVLSAALLLAPACSGLPGGDSAQGSSMTAVPERGVFSLVRGPRSETVGERTPISVGDQVEVGEKDTVRIHADRGILLEVSDGRLLVVTPSRFRLLSGKLLVTASSPVHVDAGSLRASAREAVFRVDKEFSTRVAAYSGNSVRVTSRSESLEVPAYRQVVPVQGVLPKVVRPLHFSPQDRWDRRIMSKAIDLDERVSNFAHGLEAQLVGDEESGFFARLAPDGLNADFFRPYLGSRRSDLLIGLSMAAGASKLGALPVEQRFDRIFALWNQGASWGLLAQEFEVDSVLLFSSLAEAVRRAQVQVIGPGPGLLRPPARMPDGPRARPTRRRAPAPQAPSPSPGRPAPAGRRPILPPPVTEPVPAGVKAIVEDLYGVVDPVTDLPPIL